MRLVRVVPALALLVSIVSTIALTLVLRREVGWFGGSPPVATPKVDRSVDRDHWVIPREHERDLFELVVHGADGEIPKAEQPSIADVSPSEGRVLISFEAYPGNVLTVRPAESRDDAFLRTATIAASWSTSSVPEPVKRYAAAVGEAPGWRSIWVPPFAEGPTGGRLVGALGWAIVLCALVVGNFAAAGLLFSTRSTPQTEERRSIDSRDAGSDRVGMLAGFSVAMAIGVGIVAGAHLEFRMTDYPYLVRAAHYPSGIAAMPQVLSTMTHYSVGTLLGGGRLWFAVSNVVLLGVAAACWGVLLHRIGFPRDAAVLGASLYAVGPGTFLLVRWADGVEHLSATACLMCVLLLVDLAARETAQPAAWRSAVLVLALCLSTLGVLMKYALMVVLPPSCWVWGRWLVRNPARPMDRSVTYLAFAVAVVGAVLLLPPGETSPLGFAPSGRALAAIGDRISRTAVVVAIFSVVSVWKALWSGRRVLARRGALEPLLAVARWRIGRLPLPAWVSALFAIWFLPFAFHAGYEGEAYYGMLASAPLSAAAALLIWSAAAGADVRGWREFAVAAVACAVLLPATEVRSELTRVVTDPPDRFAVWVDRLRPLALARTRPERIVVVRTCAAQPPAAALKDEMEGMFGTFGVWWATRWYDVPVEFRDVDTPAALAPSEPTTVTFGYCPGRPPTIE